MKDTTLYVRVEDRISILENKMALCLQTDPLSARSQKKAEIELRETPQRMQEATAELRNLLENDDKLYFDTDEEYLRIYLRRTKYYPESAYKLMRRVADFKKANSQLLKDLSPSSERDSFFNVNVLNVLAERDQHGRRILVFNCGKTWDPSKFNTDKLFRTLYMVHLASVMEPETQVNGFVIILDCAGMGWKQAKAFTPAFSNRLLTFIQDVMPSRLKEVHIINQPFLFSAVWQIFKPFIGDKLKKRLHIHGSNLKEMHKYLDPDYLPEELGGKRPRLDYTSADWYPVIFALEDKIKEWNSYGYVKW